ncbi:hypothetical protein [Terribacillus saccharophilus]|uniref:hypothetical protein n=1 Tax=Terribacillus saccharophilus TaxID=361277 RepID=UPI003D2B4608
MKKLLLHLLALLGIWLGIGMIYAALNMDDFSEMFTESLSFAERFNILTSAFPVWYGFLLVLIMIVWGIGAIRIK